MWVDDEFLGGSFVEILIAFGRFIQANYFDIYRFGDLYFIVQDGVHQLAMILHNRTLARVEGV